MITDGSHPSHMDPDPAQTPSSTALQSTTQQPWVCPSLEPRRSTIAADGEPLDDTLVGRLHRDPSARASSPLAEDARGGLLVRRGGLPEWVQVALLWNMSSDL